MSNIDKYAQFIADQIKQDSLFGPVYTGKKQPTETVVLSDVKDGSKVTVHKNA